MQYGITSQGLQESLFSLDLPVAQPSHALAAHTIMQAAWRATVQWPALFVT